MKTVADLSGGRDNNFNLLRFIAAVSVLVSHSYALSTGKPGEEPLRASLGTSLGDISVVIFFITSGFLVTGSLLARRDLADFFIARALRIYPGLIVSVVLTVVVVAGCFTELAPNAFFSDRTTWRFLVSNSAMLGRVEYSLPGTFAHLPYPDAVNGSLWSLPIEIRLYLLLASLWWLFSALRGPAVARFKAACAFIAIAATAIDLGFFWCHVATYEPYQSPFFVDLAGPFFIGSMFRSFQDRIPISGAVFFTLALGLVISVPLGGFLIFYKLAVGYLVLYLALVPGGAIRRFNRIGDYSYGIYIYAFVVQQAIASLMPGVGPLTMTTIAMPVTICIAIASWHLLERPAMGAKRRRTEASVASPRAGTVSRGKST